MCWGCETFNEIRLTGLGVSCWGIVPVRGLVSPKGAVSHHLRTCRGV